MRFHKPFLVQFEEPERIANGVTNSFEWKSDLSDAAYAFLRRLVDKYFLSLDHFVGLRREKLPPPGRKDKFNPIAKVAKYAEHVNQGRECLRRVQC